MSKAPSRRHSLKVGLAFVGIVTAVVLMFQNCADPMNFAEVDNLSFNDKLPFAFDAKIDTISYMSCSNVPADFDRRAIFSFRAGAYFPGSGLKLTKSFRDMTKNFRPIDRAKAVAESATNRGTVAQLGIRPAKGYQSVLTNSGTAVENLDYMNMLVPLDTQEVALPVSELELDDERINYFPNLVGLDARIFEGSLYFNSDESTAQSVRGHLQQGAMLSLTYVPSITDGFVARSSEPGSTTKVYGQGVQIVFRQPSGSVSGVNRVMDRVTEYDLETNYSSGPNVRAWACPSIYAFKIIRPSDIPLKATCTQSVDNAVTPDEQAKLKAIRSVLRPEDWWVDVKNNCVVPKTAGNACYGNEASQTVVYGTADCSSTDNSKLCAHYVSVCQRQP